MYLVTIKRKTSKYNKYMLWTITGTATETGANFVEHTKTLKEATKKFSSKPELYKIINIIK